MDRTDHGGIKKVCFKVSEDEQEDSGHDTMSYRDSYRCVRPTGGHQTVEASDLWESQDWHFPRGRALVSGAKNVCLVGRRCRARGIGSSRRTFQNACLALLP